MVQGVSELAAMFTGLIGLIGAAATTGLPMWKVTAFIGADIIVMETRWEGLWMNCYRQANIRMQCKVYDSLLFLPPELQAARGLMCCSVALSGLGLLAGLAGMQCISCIRGNDRAKTIILMVAGGMQLAASICVFIPVSWTGHVIITDFYNPLLIDAQKRELGEALYIGWVTGAVLFASGLLFLCRRMPSDKGSFDVYPQANLLSYKTVPNRANLMPYRPISTASSLQSSSYGSSLQHSSIGHLSNVPLQNVPQVMTNDGTLLNQPVVYNSGPPENTSLLYQSSMPHQASMQSSNPGSLYASGNTLYVSQNPTPYTMSYISGNPTASYQSSFHPVAHSPIFIGYKASIAHPDSHSGSGRGVYI